MSNRVKFTPEQKMFFVLKFRELKKDISEYIKFYNEERLQKNLGNRSPIEYRKFKEKNVDN